MKFTFAPESRPLDGYTIKRAIHRGGFGEVYYALSDGGKEVALKLLNNNLDVELRGVRQCLNLKHPNLVTIFDIRTDADGDHWVVMEYVSGRGLYETLQDHPQGMSVEDILQWLEGMTAGLSFLHDRGIVHRDLKPANVFRDQRTVKIGDVGLSKYISESRRSAQTQSVGTVYYMAPEVARGRYGREVDIYALGIILYEMLTGNVPFDGQTTAEILMKHLTAEPDLSVLPEKLRPVIADALEKDPEKRIASADEFYQRFCLAVQGVDIKAPVPGTKQTRQAKPSADADTVVVSDTDLPPEPRRRTAPLAEETQPAVAADAEATSGAAGSVNAIRDLWNSIPRPLQWVLGGSIALFVIESGLLRHAAVGGVIGGAAYLAYQIFVVFRNAVHPAPVHRSTAQRQRSPQPQQGASRRAQNSHAAPAAQKRKRGTGSRRVPPRSVPLTPATPRRISGLRRATDIVTSLSLALVAAFLVTVAVYLTTDLLSDIAEAAYFGSVTTLCAWALIVPCKMWEGRPGDGLTRRLCLGCVGLVVGFLAAEMAEYLLINHDPLFRGHGPPIAYVIGRITVADGSGYPTVACFMIFFAALFAARRWWWLTDSFRPARFRMTSALLTLVIGIVISGLLQDYSFPDALGATWALAVSAVVQLASGWMPGPIRTQAVQKQQQTGTASPEIVCESEAATASAVQQSPVRQGV